jgi:tryptophan halogenase
LNVIIIGGGTSGYLAAYELQSLEHVESITLIEDSSVGIIGTGEGSTGLFTYFVDKAGESGFLKQTSSTYKLGVVYKDWGTDYIAPIDTPPVANKNELYSSDYAIDETHLNAFLIKNGYNPNVTINGHAWSVAGSRAYHFDGHEVGKFFKFLCNHKVTVVDDSVIDVNVVENKIQSLTGKSGINYTGNYFVDCSGFSRVLANKFNLEWDDYSDHLLIDTAMPFLMPSTIRNHTVAKAMDYGWCWEIPKQNNLGCGYNFSSRFTTNEEALNECKKVYGNITPIKFIKYQPGCYKTTMGDNWCLIGIANGFLEPLEATTIHTTILNIFSMIDVMLGEQSVEVHNELSYKMSQDMRDFIQLHYFCGRSDTEFWRMFNDERVKISDAQKQQLDYISANEQKSAFMFIGYELLYPMLKGMKKTRSLGTKPSNEVLSFIRGLESSGFFKKYNRDDFNAMVQA